MDFLIKLLSLMLFSTIASAQTYWLNIASSYSKTADEYYESTSYPVFGEEACQAGIMHFAKLDDVHFISCDVNPLADAATWANHNQSM